MAGRAASIGGNDEAGCRLLGFRDDHLSGSVRETVVALGCRYVEKELQEGGARRFERGRPGLLQDWERPAENTGSCRDLP